MLIAKSNHNHLGFHCIYFSLNQVHVLMSDVCRYVMDMVNKPLMLRETKMFTDSPGRPVETTGLWSRTDKVPGCKNEDEISRPVSEIRLKANAQGPYNILTLTYRLFLVT